MTTYAIAHNLIGFRSSSLRVKVTRQEPGYVWVITADLLDAGTKMVLDPSQVEAEQPVTYPIHQTGLVAFAG